MVCDAVLVFDVISKTCCNVKAHTYEVLREHGISHCTPHPVLLTQTRSCLLHLPPPAEKIPAWKTVRPRKKLEESQVEENREIFHFVLLFSLKCGFCIAYIDEHVVLTVTE